MRVYWQAANKNCTGLHILDDVTVAGKDTRSGECSVPSLKAGRESLDTREDATGRYPLRLSLTHSGTSVR